MIRTPLNRVLRRWGELSHATQITITAAVWLYYLLHLSGEYVAEVVMGKRALPKLLLFIMSTGLVGVLIFLGAKLVRAGTAPELVISITIICAAILAAVLTMSLVILFRRNGGPPKAP